VDDAPQLCSNRPVKTTGSNSSARWESVETPTTNALTEGTVPATVTPPNNPPFSLSAAPAKSPSRKARTTPSNDTNTSNPIGYGNVLNIGSSCSSMATEKTEKTGQRNAPPSLPQHRASTSRDATLGGSEESEVGIVESSRSYLTRLSLEDAVVALERLRFLMMSHTAAVTGSQLDTNQTAVVLPPQQMHVDPFKLSKRPLEDIAEELCSQLRRLTTAYAVASAADRCLLGVPDSRRPTQPFISSPTAARDPLDSAPLTSSAEGKKDVDNSSTNGNNGDLLGTFGPMVSTRCAMMNFRSNSDGNFLDSRMSGETDDSWGVIDLHKPNPGPRIAYPPREDSDAGVDFGSTVYKYPNGMVVSYPISTFGDLVSTESGQGTVGRSRGATLLGSERHITVSDGTQTDDTLEPTKKEKELQAYVKALEARLTEKQRLEAMRESRGAKKSGISETLSKLARPMSDAAVKAPKQATASTHAHVKKGAH
jgi:hypothetical protein